MAKTYHKNNFNTKSEKRHSYEGFKMREKSRKCKTNFNRFMNSYSIDDIDEYDKSFIY